MTVWLVSDEARKKLIYLASAMFLCRKLASLDWRPSPAREVAFREAIDTATELMRRVKRDFPALINLASTLLKKFRIFDCRPKSPANIPRDQILQRLLGKRCRSNREPWFIQPLGKINC